MTPAQFEAYFAGLDTTVSGGGVWNFSLLADSGSAAAEYTAAIEKGLTTLQEKVSP